jgi:dipeptidyl aminopeptidase/acylaminoacyl peptidase
MPKAMVDFVSPTSLKDLYYDTPSNEIRNVLSSVIGNVAGIDSLMYHSSSPLRFVSPTSPPTLIVHGNADELVPISQSVMLRDALEANGVPCVYKVYSGETHNMSATAINSAISELVLFLNQHIN